MLTNVRDWKCKICKISSLQSCFILSQLISLFSSSFPTSWSILKSSHNQWERIFASSALPIRNLLCFDNEIAFSFASTPIVASCLQWCFLKSFPFFLACKWKMRLTRKLLFNGLRKIELENIRMFGVQDNVLLKAVKNYDKVWYF